MSNLLRGLVGEERCTRNPCSSVSLLLEPQLKEIDDLQVRRVLPAPEKQMVGPFIFFDHFGPAELAPGRGMDVRPHPHINLATITYLFEGVVRHRDSLGKVQDILPGAVNLMLAGRGIVHSERTPAEKRSDGHRLHGLQLWIALPEESEEDPPAFFHYAAEELPRIEEDGCALTLIMGEAWGKRSPVRTFSPTFYADATLAAGARLRIPDHVAERGLYLVSGALQTGDYRLREQSMTLFRPQAGIEVRALDDSRFALLGGEPLGARAMFWNFISSRRERIDQAKRDWREGRFAKVPGETEFIPLPKERS